VNLVARAAAAPVAAAAGACAALAALSLLLPSTPTYDPWAWLVWGRQLAEGGLDTTAGPAWKPLTVAVAAVLAPLGDAAPGAWLVVARAAGLLALVMAALVAARLAPAGRGGMAAVLAPLGVLATGDALWHTGVGNAEGAALALMLLALWWGLARRPAAALAALALASLVRVEAWPLLVVAALACALRAPRVRIWGAALVAAVPVLWLVPDRLGSGRWDRSAERARVLEPGAPGLAEHPVIASLQAAAGLLPPLVAAGALLVLVPAVRRRLPRAAPVPLAAGLAWVAIVAAMAATGTSGEPRYHLPGVALVAVTAAAALAAAVPARGRSAVAAATAAALVAPALPGLADQWRRLGYEARLYGGLGPAVAAAGGADTVRACGPAGTGPLSKPALAWRLGVPLRAVAPRAVPAGTVFAAPPVREAPVAPDPVALPVLATAGPWTVHRRCGTGRAEEPGRAVPAARGPSTPAT